MDRIVQWVVGFFRFWYEFIVGDDWTLAVAVVLGLLVTSLLRANKVTAWWLVPIIVIGMVGLSLRRASRAR